VEDYDVDEYKDCFDSLHNSNVKLPDIIPPALALFYRNFTEYTEILYNFPFEKLKQAKYFQLTFISRQPTPITTSPSSLIKRFDLFGYIPELNNNIPPYPVEFKLFDKSVDFGSETFVPSAPFSPGLIRWIGSERSLVNYDNPYVKLKLTLSHPLHNQNMHIKNILNYVEAVDNYWGGSTPIWFKIDLGDYVFKLTNFALRHGYSAPNSFTQNFQVSGSMNGVNWEVIYHQVAPGFTIGYDVKLFLIPPNPNAKFYRHFKFEQIQNHTQNLPYLCISGFEMYGTVKAG